MWSTQTMYVDAGTAQRVDNTEQDNSNNLDPVHGWAEVL